VDCDVFQSSDLVVVEVKMLLEPCEHELYDCAFPVDTFQRLRSLGFEVFGYAENIASICFLVSWVRDCGFDSVSFSRLSEFVAGVLAVSSQLTYRCLCDLDGSL